MTTAAKRKTSVVSIEALLGQQGELFKRLLKESLQEGQYYFGANTQPPPKGRAREADQDFAA